MQTASNISYLVDRVNSGFTPNQLSSANQGAFDMLSELTEKFTDTDMIYEDSSFEKSLDLLVKAMKESSGPKKEEKPLPQYELDQLVYWDQKKGTVFRVVNVPDEVDEHVGDFRYTIVDDSLRIPIRTFAREAALKAAPPRKKPLSDKQKKSAETIKKQARGKKTVKATAKKDGADFAERMRKVRAAKTNQNSNQEAAAPGTNEKKSSKKAKVAKEKTAKSKPEPTPKPEKIVQPSKQDQAYLNAKHVKVPSVELKHIKRFVSLTKEGTWDKVVGALEALQIDIRKGVLNKKSPFTDEIEEMQSTYIAILNNNKAPYKVHLSEERLAHYVGLAGGEKVYKSVEILLKYTRWTEESKTEAQIHKLLTEIRNAIKKGKILKSDPYSDEVRALETMLASAGSGKKFNAQKIDLEGIKGLGSLGCACMNPSVQGLGNLPAPSNGVMKATDLMNFNYPVYEFQGKWETLFGHPQKNAKIMIWGEPGQGKSTMAYQFARYLASTHGKVLYNATEEINKNGQASMTVQTKLKSVGGPVEGWEFAGNLDRITGNYPFVIIDSVNNAGLTLEMFEKLTAKYPNTCFILIFQATKEGQFKGEKDWEHDVDIVVKIEAGKAHTVKNRFAALSTVTIF